MEIALTEEEAKVKADGVWARLFNYKIQKDLLRYCVYSISLNDVAHNLSHVMDVSKLGVSICEQLGLGERDTLLVYMGCLLHDIGCRYERKQHHLIGYGLTYELINRYCPGDFTDEEILIIATAVLEHRSSNPEKPSNLISGIVSVSDSGAPDFAKYVKRAVQFRLKRKLSTEVIIEDVYKHLLEKFGVEGYHWKSYPEIGMELFKNEWDDFSNKLYDEENCMSVIKDTYHALGGGNEQRNTG
jgi:exopolyphosphatase/pppGpp-phosphohydrolase